MEEQAVLLESLYEKAKQYADTSIEIAKLKALDKTSDVVSSLVPRIIVILLLFIFIFILNIAISLWLGELMGRSYYGFLVVSGFYILTAGVVHFFVSSSMKKKIKNNIINSMLN